MWLEHFAALLIPTISAVAAAQHNAEPVLEYPDTIFVSAGRLTQGRQPVQQLSCTGGSGAAYYRLTNLTCAALSPITRLSEDDVQWKCTTELPLEFVLGGTTVSCEEREERIEMNAKTLVKRIAVPGSCAVAYTIHLSDMGEQYESQLQRLYASDESYAHKQSATTLSERLFKWMFWTVFLGIGTFMLYNIFSRDNHGNLGHGSDGAGDGAGGHGGTGGSGNPGDEDGHDAFPGDESSARPATWSPINQYSALSGDSSSRRNYGRYAGMDRDVLPSTSRPQTSSSSLAPPLASSNQGYSQTRQSTSFGGTTRR